MVESTVKSTRRKETVDGKYFENLFADTRSLYRLDQLDTNITGKAPLGKLPVESIALLAALAGIWLCIGIYFLATRKRKKDGA